MKIYVAGSFKDRKRIELTWINRLKSLGYEITHNWTQFESDRFDENGVPLRDVEYHKNCAKFDKEGVVNSDVVVAVIDSHLDYYHYRGTNYEMGVAEGSGIPVIIYNPWHNPDNPNMDEIGRICTNVFYWSENVTHIPTAFGVLRELERICAEKEKLKEEILEVNDGLKNVFVSTYSNDNEVDEDLLEHIVDDELSDDL